jgi:membrane associated rhomboid family serine protease
MIKPQINPMIGPSPYVTINMGARYVSCMHNMDYFQELTEANSFPCPNTLARNGSDRHTGKMCNLGQLCGFNLDNSSIPGIGAPSGTALEDKHQPDQWFRFIVPIFLHAGIVHIGFNMLLQMTLGREMEMIIGSIRYFLVYFASGIFGFVLGGNFAAEGIASTGASGALFGILALTLLDLLYHWAERISPWKDFAFIMLDVAISFVLGLLPGLDNFSHIGGFIMGIALGICILHSPASLQKRIGQDPPYRPVHQSKSDDHLITGTQAFAKAPVGFFKGRKPAWWAWWLVRVASLVFLLIVFILLLTNFYKSIQNRATCSWCKYITCIVSYILPSKEWQTNSSRM